MWIPIPETDQLGIKIRNILTTCMQSNDMDIMVIIILKSKQNQQPDRVECIIGEEISFSSSSSCYGDGPLTKLLPISLTFGRSVKVVK